MKVLKALSSVLLALLLLFNASPKEVASAADLILDPPTVIQTAPGFNSVTLAWNRVANAEAYDIYMSEAANGTYELAEAGVKSTIHEVHFSNGKKLQGRQTYYFKIKAKTSNTVSDFSHAVSQKTDAFNPADGWAATGDGTTGGDLSTDYVIVTTYDELKTKIAERKDTTNTLAKSPYLTIYVKGLLKGNADITLQDVHNVSIVGLGSDAIIDGYGFIFKASSNVIVRNLTIRNALITKGVDIQSSKNIYFEHNNFSNGKDGLTDIKSASDLVTMAWNRYSKHEKTMLIGSGWSATSSDRGKLSVTIHHNWFEGTQERHPRVRFGKVHVYNNYYTDIINYGAASTSEAQVLLEGNYFQNVPIVAMYSRSPLDKSLNNLLSNDPLGLMKVTDTNKIVGTGGLYDQLLEATYEDAANVPNRGQAYSWSFYPDRIPGYTYTVDNADKAKSDIERYSGVEKKPVFTIDTLETPTNIKSTFTAKGIDLAWDRVQGATGYEVKYSTSANGPFKEVSANMPSVTLPVGSVSLGAAYYVSVTASSGNAISIDSRQETIKAALPDVPSKPTLQRLDKSFKVSWNDVPNADSYTITLTNKTTNETTAIPNVRDSFYLLSSLDTGTTYSFAVQAVNYFGSSAKSAASEDKAAAAAIVPGVNWVVKDIFDNATEDTPIEDFGYVGSKTGTPGASVGENYVKFLSGDVDGSNKGPMSLFLKDSNSNFATVVTKNLTKNTTETPFLGKFVFDIDFKEAPPEDSKPIRLLDSDGKVVVSLRVDSQSGNLYYSVKNGADETNTNHLLVLSHNVWYNIRIVVDMDAKLVDVYINSQLYLAGAPLYDPTAKDITSFRGETSNGGIKPIQYRNVKAGIVTEAPGNITGDLNGDGKTSILDLAIMAKYYGKSDKDPNWNDFKIADLNKDGKIELLDLAIVARMLIDQE
ncbi:dockerin type I domain-containing protein [Paenibacillus sp. RC67]|uniref:pectate lyase family protein n=1 Tax=Paenibacillus sp. RC67 TaxID=3039392 RepID=UPI0024AC876D|nr:dockerin type I domain-containing protein [Paenibacillus sp. RC67]